MFLCMIVLLKITAIAIQNATLIIKGTHADGINPLEKLHSMSVPFVGSESVDQGMK